MNTNAGRDARLVSPEEKTRALQYLTLTREKLREAVAGLSNAQWQFNPAPGRWSIAEVVEHLAIVEGGIHRLIGKLAEAPEAEAGRDDSQIDELILAKVPNRTRRAEAPPAIQPAGRWNPEQALQQFLERRRQTEQLLDSAPFLRGRLLPHPLLGDWDGYQWILGTAAHSARHTEQILEIKECVSFPKT